MWIRKETICKSYLLLQSTQIITWSTTNKIFTESGLWAHNFVREKLSSNWKNVISLGLLLFYQLFYDTKVQYIPSDSRWADPLIASKRQCTSFVIKKNIINKRPTKRWLNKEMRTANGQFNAMNFFEFD